MQISAFPFSPFQIFVYSCLFKDFCFSYFHPQKLESFCVYMCFHRSRMKYCEDELLFLFLPYHLMLTHIINLFELCSRSQYDDEKYEGNVFSSFSSLCAPEKSSDRKLRIVKICFVVPFYSRLIRVCLYIFSIANFYFMLIKQGAFSSPANLSEFMKKGCRDFKSSSEWKLDEGNGVFSVFFITFLFLLDFMND